MKRIDRTLLWFRDGNQQLSWMDDTYYCLGILLNNLLNEKYLGKKLKFCNIYFKSQAVYDLYPNVKKNSFYFYGGHLSYYGFIDFYKFRKLDELEKKHFLWKQVYEYLQDFAIKTGNKELIEASEYAYQRGIEKNLNADYRRLELDIDLYGINVKASLWIQFKSDGMYSSFTIEKEGKLIFEKEIDKVKLGVEFFLVMYKKIEVKNNVIILKGHRDVDNLPMKIVVDKELISG